MRRLPFLCALLGFTLISLSSTLATERTALRAKPTCSQMIVTVADGWDSSTGKLQCYDRTRKGWEPAFDRPIPVLLGRNG